MARNLAESGAMVQRIWGVLAPHADTLEKLTGAAESAATVVALIVGGLWTYRLFVKNRGDKPRAEVRHEVSVWPIAEDQLLIHVAVSVKNTSAVMMLLKSGEVRAVPMLPAAPQVWNQLADGVPHQKGHSELVWPNRLTQSIDWSSSPRELEPGEQDTYHFDFVMETPVSLFQVYSHLQNVAKEPRSIGWNCTTLHPLESRGASNAS